VTSQRLPFLNTSENDPKSARQPQFGICCVNPQLRLYNAITTKPSPRSSETSKKNGPNNTPNAKLTLSTFLSSIMYKSLLECYGASSIIAIVEECLETAPDEEDLHVHVSGEKMADGTLILRIYDGVTYSVYDYG
jgi:hypothetical protein